ncbi:MAG: hypothetical protein V4466_09510 [Pseudomonadota bacterium]
MRTISRFCATIALLTAAGTAAAQPAPIPQPVAPPVTAPQARATWTYLGVHLGDFYAGPVTRSKTGTRLAWDASLFNPPVMAKGRPLVGQFYLREFDCKKAAVRMLYIAIVTETAVVRWDRTEPSEWLPRAQLRAEPGIKNFERVCGG